MERVSASRADAGYSGLFCPIVYDELRSLSLCGDLDFESNFRIFIRDLEEDFRETERTLRLGGNEDIRDLRKMHADLLGLLNYAQARVMSADLHFGRKLVRLMVQRFPPGSLH
jgi:hypothetical protein